MMPPTPEPDRRAAGRRTFSERFNAGLTVVLAKLKVEEVPHIRRIVITVVGGTILVLGTALVALPVPGSGPLVILGGLAILGTEYAWARRWMRKGKRMANKALSRTQQILSIKKAPAGAPAAREAETADPEEGDPSGEHEELPAGAVRRSGGNSHPRLP